jgi:hypothetical protein
MKVLDSQGAELKQGDRVVRVFRPGGLGGVKGTVVTFGHREVVVAFVREREARFELTRRFPFSRTFTCPDLVLCPEVSR